MDGIALLVWAVIIFGVSVALLGGIGWVVGAVLAVLYVRWQDSVQP